MNASEILIDVAKERYPIGTVVKSALTGTEFTSSGSFIVNEDRSIYLVDKKGAFSVYDARMKKWAEVVEQYKKCTPTFCMVSHDGFTLDLYDKCFFVDKHDMKPVGTTMKVAIREAAEKWISEQKPKSILEGKVAIQVNNEREFKLLMEHYESKGWKWMDDNMKPFEFIPGQIKRGEFLQYVAYHNKFHYCDDAEWLSMEGYKIIPFSDFAAEVGIKATVFVMTSEDGVPIYRCDKIWLTRATRAGKVHCKWNLPLSKICAFNIESKLLHDSSNAKAFSTKEAAEAWILEANKPKKIKVEIDSDSFAIVHESAVDFHFEGHCGLVIEGLTLIKIIEALKQLQQQSDKNASE